MAKKPCIIGISGPSCAGKTALGRALVETLGSEKAVLLGLDSYYRDLAEIPPDRRARHNFDTPEAIDERLFMEQMDQIAAGHPVEKPVYDFKTHIRRPETERVVPKGIVIVDGLFALHWEAIRRLYDIKVFVDAPDQICLARRIERDIRERGRPAEFARRQYEETVRPMAARHLFPTKQYADIVLDGEASLEELVEAVLELLSKKQRQ